jgi:hypothetical protein
MKMKAKGYSAGGAPMGMKPRNAVRPSKRPLSSAQKNMLDGVQGSRSEASRRQA